MTTVTARVGLLSSVDAVMALERCQPGEGPSALLTVERTFPRVSLLVSFQPEQLDKRHATFLTLIGLVLPVDHLVFGKQVRLLKPFAARWTSIRFIVVFLRFLVFCTRLVSVLNGVLVTVHYRPRVPGHAVSQDHHGTLDLVHIAQVPPDISCANETLVTLWTFVWPVAGMNELVHSQICRTEELFGTDGTSV